MSGEQFDAFVQVLGPPVQVGFLPAEGLQALAHELVQSGQRGAVGELNRRAAPVVAAGLQVGPGVVHVEQGAAGLVQLRAQFGHGRALGGGRFLKAQHGHGVAGHGHIQALRIGRRGQDKTQSAVLVRGDVGFLLDKGSAGMQQHGRGRGRGGLRGQGRRHNHARAGQGQFFDVHGSSGPRGAGF